MIFWEILYVIVVIAYVSLDDAPGVGQADVSLSAEQLQAFFQVTLSVMVNL